MLALIFFATSISTFNVLANEVSEEILRIEVKGQQQSHELFNNSILPVYSIIDESSNYSDSLATLASQSASVNLNGQGGLFQTVNIRGLSRWRIMSFIESIPIHTERRAGTAAEFIPPRMIGQAYVLAGAASTQLGSGALGGGIDFTLAKPQDIKLSMTHGTNNNYREMHLQGASNARNIAWAVNHRKANNSSDESGNDIQDRFEKHSVMLRTNDPSSLFSKNLLLYSNANNIAKADAIDPSDRFTIYPKNEHLLLKTTLNWQNTTFYLHRVNLQTQIVNPQKQTSVIVNKANNMGIYLYNNSDIEDVQLSWRVGVDGRIGVKVEEVLLDLVQQTTFNQKSLNANQWEAFAMASAAKLFDTGSIISGIRFSQMHQQNRDINSALPSYDNFNVSGYIGYEHIFNHNWRVYAYSSTAFRNPSLTERFFNGSTPRGTTLSSTQLNSEESLNYEVKLRYTSENKELNISAFHQDIDNYIERIALSDTVRTYQNLLSAKIKGINYEYTQNIVLSNIDININLNGQLLNGQDNVGNSIADVPPNQHNLTFSINSSLGYGFLTVTHRQSSDNIVEGENSTNSANILALGYTYLIDNNWTASIRMNNLTDSRYVVSRDDLAPFARGRDVIFSAEYQF